MGVRDPDSLEDVFLPERQFADDMVIGGNVNAAVRVEIRETFARDAGRIPLRSTGEDELRADMGCGLVQTFTVVPVGGPRYLYRHVFLARHVQQCVLDSAWAGMVAGGRAIVIACGKSQHHDGDKGRADHWKLSRGPMKAVTVRPPSTIWRRSSLVASCETPRPSRISLGLESGRRRLETRWRA